MSKFNGSSLPDAINEDERIAQLLAKEARDCSVRYSTLGSYGSAPRRPPSTAPKPNTRFLRHIIRETDTHNANLKKKEEEEARERMRQLRRRDRSKEGNGHHRREPKRRRIELVEEHDRDRYRHRDKDRRSHRSRGSERLERSRRGDDNRHDTLESEGRQNLDVDGGLDERASLSKGDLLEKDNRRRHHERRHRRRRSTERTSEPQSPIEGDDRHHSRSKRSERRSRRRSRDRSRSPRAAHHRSREKGERKLDKFRIEKSKTADDASPVNDAARSKADSPSRPRHISNYGSRKTPFSDTESQHSATDSDPLSNLIGPRPPSPSSLHTTIDSSSSHQTLRPRGRGAYKSSGTSNIDAHFSEHYDPAGDVHLDSDDDNHKNKTTFQPRPVPGLTAPLAGSSGTGNRDDDWDMALEALRDRALWRSKGAERLREAGFEDKVVEKWEKNSAFSGLGQQHQMGDRDSADVKWGKRGEGREWDRGKVTDEDGHVSVKPTW